MGKGYNNFMSKKPFHPASKENIKRVWMAEQRSIDSKKKEDEMRLQYEKEQDLYNNRLLVAGSDSKDKLSLNFMYEAPPGVRKENSKEMETEDEPQYKFEWQRNAPRESFAKNNMDIRDQPFGIQVRNVRCLKCHKWGHVNTDRECPLFNTTSLPAGNPSTDTNKSSSSSATKTSNSGDKPPVKIEPNELIESMKEDQGLALKKSLYGNYGPESMKNNDHHQMLLLNAAVQNPEQSFLESLSSKQKKILLKKLQSLNKSSSSSSKHKTDKKHKKKHKKESSSRKKKSKKVHKSKDSSDSSSSSDSESDNDDDRKRNLDKKSRHSDIEKHHHNQKQQYSKNQHSSSSKYSNNDRHNKDRRDDDKDDYHHRRRKSRSRSPENGHHRRRRN